MNTASRNFEGTSVLVSRPLHILGTCPPPRALTEALPVKYGVVRVSQVKPSNCFTCLE